MTQIIDAIKSLKPTQRLVAFLFLVLMTSLTAIVTVYLKNSDCKACIEENLQMHEAYAKLSEFIRINKSKENFKMFEAANSKIEGSGGGGPVAQIDTNYINFMDSLLEMVEPYEKRK